MPMKNPPHPGLSVLHDCLEPLGLSVTEAAQKLGVSRKQLSSLVNCRAGISPEMAIRPGQGIRRRGFHLVPDAGGLRHRSGTSHVRQHFGGTYRRWSNRVMAVHGSSGLFVEHEQVVLTADVSGDEGEQLESGDVGTIIHVHPGGEAFVVEFMTLDGEHGCHRYRPVPSSPTGHEQGHHPCPSRRKHPIDSLSRASRLQCSIPHKTPCPVSGKLTLSCPAT